MRKAFVSSIRTERSITAKDIKEFLETFARRQMFECKFLIPVLDEFEKIEKLDKRVSDIVMNVMTYTGFRKLCVVDKHTDYPYLKQGLMASLWGANIWVVRDCEKDVVEVYGEGDKELFKNHPNIKKSYKVLFKK